MNLKIKYFSILTILLLADISQAQNIQSMKSAKVRSGIDLTVPPNIPFVPTYKLKLYDTGQFFDILQPDRFNISQTGIYNIGASIIWEYGTGNREFGLAKLHNGVWVADLVYLTRRSISNFNDRMMFSVDAKLEIGDQIVIFVRHNSFGPLRIFNVNELSVTFWIHQIEIF